MGLNELKADLEDCLKQMKYLIDGYGLKSTNTIFHQKFAYWDERARVINRKILNLGSTVPLFKVSFDLEGVAQYVYFTQVSESDAIILLTILYPKADNIMVTQLPLGTPQKLFSQE